MAPDELRHDAVNRRRDLVVPALTVRVRAMPIDGARAGDAGRCVIDITGRSWQIRVHGVSAAVGRAVSRAAAHLVTAVSSLVDGSPRWRRVALGRSWLHFATEPNAFDPAGRSRRVLT